MLENVERAFRAFTVSLQTAQLYGTEHQKFIQSADAAVQALRQACEDRQELVFGIVGNELAWEKEILFDLTKSVAPVIAYFKVRKIERLSFGRDVQQDDIKKFFTLLLERKDQTEHDLQERLTLAGVRTIAVGKIRAANEDEAQEAASNLELYLGSAESFNRAADAVLDGKEPDFLGLRFNVNAIFESLLSGSQELLKIAVLKRYDQSTFSHTVNVATLAIFFSSRLGFEREDVLDIGMAALFHDIGKTGISRAIIRKSGSLSDEEFSKIKSHTVYGAELLLEHVDTLGMLPVLAAFEHHLKSDQRSYPRLSFAHPPHVASAVIAVCDIYDALLSRRSYKTALPPETVHEIMMMEKTRLHFPQLVDMLFSLVGVWPVGTLVRLSDASIAVVRIENEQDIFGPVVEILAPEEKRQTLDLSRQTAGLTITASIDPASEEGKTFVQKV